MPEIDPVVVTAPSSRCSLARPPRVVWPKGLSRRPDQCQLRRERERGAVLVEFALVLPIFLALVFGTISYGYMLSYRQALSQAASEGARAAAMVPSGVTTDVKVERARAAFDRALSNYGVTCVGQALMRKGSASGTCSVQAKTPCPVDATRMCAVVTVSYAYRAHPIIQTFPGLGITLPQNLTYTAVVEVN